MNPRQQHWKDFDDLIRAFIDIPNQLAGARIEKEHQFLYNAEGLGKKLIDHIITIHMLSQGYRFEDHEPTIDFSSIAILARSVLETYLTHTLSSLLDSIKVRWRVGLMTS